MVPEKSCDRYAVDEYGLEDIETICRVRCGLYSRYRRRSFKLVTPRPIYSVVQVAQNEMTSCDTPAPDYDPVF